MKEGIFLTIIVVVFLYAAWVATGGPARQIPKEGPFITPVTRSGEEQQGYYDTAPTNSVDPEAYPRQVGGYEERVGVPDGYERTDTDGYVPPPQNY